MMTGDKATDPGWAIVDAAGREVIFSASSVSCISVLWAEEVKGRPRVPARVTITCGGASHDFDRITVLPVLHYFLDKLKGQQPVVAQLGG